MKAAERRRGDAWRATIGLLLFLSWLELLGPQLANLQRSLLVAAGVADCGPSGEGSAAWCDSRSPGSVPLPAANARQLRALPGIGRGRARELVELGQRRGAALELDDWSVLPGLGGRTLDGVRRYLEARDP